MSRRDHVLAAVVLTAIAFLWNSSTSAADVSVSKTKAGAVVKVDGKLFAEYITGFAPKGIGSTPILYPIIGPTGKRMTREWPMKDGPEFERQDHPHHRSLWFNHGNVNELSFWDKATIEHRKFTQLKSGPKATIGTANDWVDADGNAVCSDERLLIFSADDQTRTIDFNVTVTAGKQPVVFGDTKEGSFGIRVWETMKVDAKKNNPAWGGHIINSEGQSDGEAWGKRATWVDYYGPVEDETLGVAILNHPSSFRFPTYWHVRTYGLFAANPFGVRDFEGKDAESGAYTLEPGKSFTLRYRVIFHSGNEKEGKIAEAYQAYQSETF